MEEMLLAHIHSITQGMCLSWVNFDSGTKAKPM